LHVADRERLPAGALVDIDDRLGHPSCEGGNATGTHVHIARKYNGEWIPADGPLPFVLSGWELHGGSKSYQGYLIKGDQMIEANPGGPQSSVIVR
jgi:LasA protease